MSHQLPPLPYARDALAPHISAETIDYHYGKHHQGYITKLNTLIKGTPQESKTLEELVKTADGAVFNCAAQAWNHTFYWNSMSPKGGGQPAGRIAEAIQASFGDFETFKKQFTDAAVGHFGSGWAWVVLGADGKLKIHQTHDAGCPLRGGVFEAPRWGSEHDADGSGKPILVIDVWEHAYYIDYRNARDKYVAAFWNVVNWEFASSNL